MAMIENEKRLVEQLRDMTDEQLIGQELVQQGAVHAISYLLAHGCTRDGASEMLESLRSVAGAVRAEIARRGSSPLFESDQLADDAPHADVPSSDGRFVR